MALGHVWFTKTASGGHPKYCCCCRKGELAKLSSSGMRGTGNALGRDVGLISTGDSCKEGGLIPGDGRCRDAANWDSHIVQQLASTALSFFPSPLEVSSSLQFDVVQLFPSLHTALCHCQV